jgi:hypothetical protein
MRFYQCYRDKVNFALILGIFFSILILNQDWGLGILKRWVELRGFSLTGCSKFQLGQGLSLRDVYW